MPINYRLLTMPIGRSMAKARSQNKSAWVKSDFFITITLHSLPLYRIILSRRELFIFMVITKIIQYAPLNDVCHILDIGCDTVNDCPFWYCWWKQTKNNIYLCFYMWTIHFDEQTVKMVYFNFVSTHTFHDNDILLQDNSLSYFFICPAQGFEIVCKMWKGRSSSHFNSSLSLPCGCRHVLIPSKAFESD